MNARSLPTLKTAWRLWWNANWLYAGLVTGCFYLALLPLLRPANAHLWTSGMLLLYLQLPIYMAHQLEEHIHDRFRRYINGQLGHGLDLLTADATTVINVFGVWIVDLFALYVAAFTRAHWGLVAFYLAVINALVHLAAALCLREYNPGLVTAAGLLLPAGAVGAWLYSRQNTLPLRAHVGPLLLAVALHVVVVAYVARRRAALVR